jgi:hypothetical protein
MTPPQGRFAMTTRFRQLTLASTAIVAALAAGPAFADLLTIVPGGFENTGGGFQGTAPLRFPGSGGSRTQQVYESQLFGNFGGPRLITAIDLRTFPGAGPSAFFGNTVTASNIFINLSTTQFGDEGNALSTTFANNIGGDVTEVYSGGLTLTTTANGNLPVSPFDYTITFQTPFLYDPTLGNLLIDVMIPTDATLRGAILGHNTFDTVNNLNDGVYSVIDINNGNAETGFAGSSGAILRVHSEALAIAVPEPGTLALFGAGLVGAATMRRRRSARA